MKKMKKNTLLTAIVLISILMQYCSPVAEKHNESPGTFVMSKSDLQNKIKGGWAGQTIGVVYGAPVEFKYQGSLIPEQQIIPWNKHYVKYWWDKKPGLFDDIYTDLNFVQVLETYGLDVDRDTVAYHWANTEYHLAHANQASRYNILRGIMPPASGHWLNNPHADDIDFQIESDFIGLMTPAMVNTATKYADRFGHIMNSGDGWYGGVFTSALYSLAFRCNDTKELVTEALKTIPEGTQFHSCISDVLSAYNKYPEDWKACWFDVEKKWNNDVGCPKGVYLSFNIDAKINSAYVAIGLLYGKGDFGQSVDIATRCGQDADCNPATVGGVLGVMLGYDKIPAFWLDPLKEIEALNFENTSMSLANAYEMSYKHALQNIAASGGSEDEISVTIPGQQTEAVQFEQNFERSHPIARTKIDKSFTDSLTFGFTGNGYILYGNMVKRTKIDRDYIDRISKRLGSEVFGLAELDDPYTAELQLYINGQADERINLPMKNAARRTEPSWKYQMPEGPYTVKLVWLNHHPDYEIRVNDLIVYSEIQPKSNLPHTH